MFAYVFRSLWVVQVARGGSMTECGLVDEVARGRCRSGRRRLGLSYKTMPNERLASFVANGDSDAWNELYVRHWPWVVRLVLSRAGHAVTEDDAYDWAQESMLRAWRYRHAYDPTMNYRQWLRTIVVNYVMSQLVQARRRRELLEGSGLVERGEVARTGEEFWLGLGARSPDEQFAAQERASAVQRILERLSEEDQEVLRYWSEGRLDEYGQQLHVKPSTVRSRVSRARKRFKEIAQASGLF